MKAKNNPDKCQLLAEKIAAIFKRGITLSKDARHYIDSTFSSPLRGELAKILEDESSCETEPLLEMIFFPDETQQIQLEPMLTRYRFEKSDRPKILESLFSQPLETVLFFPGPQGKLRLKVPRAAAAQFISRLNISKKIDSRLLKSLDQYVDEKLKARFKVRLRNTRFDFTENKVAFLKRFFVNMKTETKIVSDCFDFLLVFFDELKDDRDIYRGLMEKKRFYFQNIQKVLRAESQLKKSNLETLILQGGRMLFFDKQEAEQNIRRIDEISRAVFNRTEPVDPLSIDIELLEQSGQVRLKKMFYILS